MPTSVSLAHSPLHTAAPSSIASLADWERKLKSNSIKFSKLVKGNHAKSRSLHEVTRIVVVTDGTIDLSTAGTVIRRASNKDSLRRGFNNAGRCHSVSWIKAKKVADYPPKASGQWPAAWFPSSKNPWWQRDLGADDETVGFVRIRPSGAPRDGQKPNYRLGKYTNPNAKGIFTTGRVGDLIMYDQQGDGWSQKREDEGWGRTSCRSGFLFKGDSCVDVRDGRGREQGIYEGDWGNEGYEVTVSDKP